MRPLVLIPGLGNTSALFDPLLTALACQDWHEDQAIHVNLQNTSVQNFENMVDHARRQLPSEPYDLLGFSMGGYVALHLAQEAGVRLHRLILLNSRAVDDREEERQERQRTLALLMHPGLKFEGMTWRLFQSLVGPAHQDDADLFARVKAMALDVGAEATAAQIRANLTRPDQRPGLVQVKVPTLVVGGAADTLTPPTQARMLAAGIEQSQLHILDDCGHLSPLERPEALAALIKAFLA